jgi:hypothetical protein
MAHDDAREGKWRGNWRMEWLASTLYTTSEHGVSRITTADAHTSAASSRLSWRPWRFKWTRPFRRKTKSDFCECAITFQTQSTTERNGWKHLRSNLYHNRGLVLCFSSEKVTALYGIEVGTTGLICEYSVFTSRGDCFAVRRKKLLLYYFSRSPIIVTFFVQVNQLRILSL